MPGYIHERPDWPRFRWSPRPLAGPLARVRHQQGRLLGRMEGLGFRLQQEAVLHTLTEDVVKSSEIEGERLDRSQVRSSIARRLGLDVGGVATVDRHVEGIVEMMLDATRALRPAPHGRTAVRLARARCSRPVAAGCGKIRVGAWRDDGTGPMQVVSGPVGRERVHFEAPAAGRVDREMAAFLEWFNADGEATPIPC